jgi:DNA-binding response OmpR family regulator
MPVLRFKSDGFFNDSLNFEDDGSKMNDAPASQSPGRVLVIEDEPSIRVLLNRVLSGAGFAVEEASDGLEGLERLSRHEFDVVLLDVWMPHMNGLDVLTELHRRGSTQRVILMTADHAPETLLHAVREQASQYISKPFSSEELLATVQKVLACPAQPAIEVLSAKPDWVQLLVPCQREVVDRIQSFLMGLDSDLPHQVRESLGQAFHELLLNAIEWGGKFDPNVKVHVACLRTRRMVLYRIADPGAGFRFDSLKHAAVSNPEEDSIEHIKVREEKGMRPGGFGILMTRFLVDELLYNEKQNEVIFIKYLD